VDVRLLHRLDEPRGGGHLAGRKHENAGGHDRRPATLQEQAHGPVRIRRYLEDDASALGGAVAVQQREVTPKHDGIDGDRQTARLELAPQGGDHVVSVVPHLHGCASYSSGLPVVPRAGRL